MVLSDKSIKEQLENGRIIIEPVDYSDIQPASVDLHLDSKFLVFTNSRQPYIDVKQSLDGLTAPVARLEGKSSLGRIGLVIHSTAGFVDPGWKGHLTLELSNLSRLPISLYFGMKIGQISFLTLSTPAERLYGSESLGSKYQGQTDPTPSRFHQDFRKQ